MQCFTISEKEKWIFASAYGAGSEKKEEERNVFWNDLTEWLERFRKKDKILYLGDLNVKVDNLYAVWSFGR